MERTNQYYELLQQVDELSDEELVALLGYVKEMIGAREQMARYDPAKDPTITGEGLFDGPPDLSERVEEILYGKDPNSNEADDRAS
jgi:hypothetical protein